MGATDDEEAPELDALAAEQAAEVALIEHTLAADKEAARAAAAAASEEAFYADVLAGTHEASDQAVRNRSTLDADMQAFSAAEKEAQQAAERQRQDERKKRRGEKARRKAAKRQAAAAAAVAAELAAEEQRRREAAAAERAAALVAAEVAASAVTAQPEPQPDVGLHELVAALAAAGDSGAGERTATKRAAQPAATAAAVVVAVEEEEGMEDGVEDYDLEYVPDQPAELLSDDAAEYVPEYVPDEPAAAQPPAPHPQPQPRPQPQLQPKAKMQPQPQPQPQAKAKAKARLQPQPQPKAKPKPPAVAPADPAIIAGFTAAQVCSWVDSVEGLSTQEAKAVRRIFEDEDIIGADLAAFNHKLLRRFLRGSAAASHEAAAAVLAWRDGGSGGGSLAGANSILVAGAESGSARAVPEGQVASPVDAAEEAGEEVAEHIQLERGGRKLAAELGVDLETAVALYAAADLDFEKARAMHRGEGDDLLISHGLLQPPPPPPTPPTPPSEKEYPAPEYEAAAADDGDDDDLPTPTDQVLASPTEDGPTLRTPPAQSAGEPVAAALQAQMAQMQRQMLMQMKQMEILQQTVMGQQTVMSQQIAAGIASPDRASEVQQQNPRPSPQPAVPPTLTSTEPEPELEPDPDSEPEPEPRQEELKTEPEPVATSQGAQHDTVTEAEPVVEPALPSSPPPRLITASAVSELAAKLGLTRGEAKGLLAEAEGSIDIAVAIYIEEFGPPRPSPPSPPPPAQPPSPPQGYIVHGEFGPEFVPAFDEAGGPSPSPSPGRKPPPRRRKKAGPPRRDWKRLEQQERENESAENELQAESEEHAQALSPSAEPHTAQQHQAKEAEAMAEALIWESGGPLSTIAQEAAAAISERTDDEEAPPHSPSQEPVAEIAAEETDPELELELELPVEAVGFSSPAVEMWSVADVQSWVQRQELPAAASAAVRAAFEAEEMDGEELRGLTVKRLHKLLSKAGAGMEEGAAHASAVGDADRWRVLAEVLIDGRDALLGPAGSEARAQQSQSETTSEMQLRQQQLPGSTQRAESGEALQRQMQALGARYVAQQQMEDDLWAQQAAATGDLYAELGPRVAQLQGDNTTAPEADVKSAQRQQIEALYAQHNPSKLADVESLIDKYGEEDLLAKVRSKYTAASPAVAPAPVGDTPPEPQREERHVASEPQPQQESEEPPQEPPMGPAEIAALMRKLQNSESSSSEDESAWQDEDDDGDVVTQRLQQQQRRNALLTELRGMRFMALQDRAATAGVAAVAIADAMNSEDPKGQIIELILTQVGGGGTTSSGTTSGGGGGAGAVAERVQAAAAPEPSLVPQVVHMADRPVEQPHQRPQPVLSRWQLKQEAQQQVQEEAQRARRAAVDSEIAEMRRQALAPEVVHMGERLDAAPPPQPGQVIHMPERPQERPAQDGPQRVVAHMPDRLDTQAAAVEQEPHNDGAGWLEGELFSTDEAVTAKDKKPRKKKKSTSGVVSAQI